MSKLIWTYEACKEVVAKCTTTQELKEKYHGVYVAIYKYDWKDLLNELAGRKKCTYEYCKKVVETCTTIQELYEKDNSVYAAIHRHGWKELLNGLVNRFKQITDETKIKCREAAEKCKTLNEYRTKYPNEYASSLRHGLLPEFDWLEKNMPEKNVCIYAYEFPALKTVYVGLTNNPKRRNGEHNGKGGKRKTTVYKFCQKNNLSVPDMKILISDLPADTEGRYWEDYYVKKFKTEGWTLLNIAPTGSNASIGTNASKLTKKECYILSLDCTSRKEFQQKHRTAYLKSLEYGSMVEWSHLKPQRNKWTDDLIWEEVYKYNSYTDFYKQSKTKAYHAAGRRGLLPEIKAYYTQKKGA